MAKARGGGGGGETAAAARRRRRRRQRRRRRRRQDDSPRSRAPSDQVYAQKVGDEGMVPKVKRAFDEADKGTVFHVDPGPGTEVEAGTR